MSETEKCVEFGQVKSQRYKQFTVVSKKFSSISSPNPNRNIKNIERIINIISMSVKK